MTYWWLAWIAAFAILEAVGYWRYGTPGTLSWNVWRWFSVTERRPFWWLRRLVLLVAMGMLTLHFARGGGWWPFTP